MAFRGCQSLVRAASWIVPREVRPDWWTHWRSALENLWVLAERGELPGRTAAGDRALLCRAAFGDAMRMRFGDGGFARLARGPLFLLGSAGGFLALLAVWTRGLSVTRWVITSAHGDRLVGYTAPIVLAMMVGTVLASITRVPLRRYGWRYWTFLAAKIAALAVIAPLVWIECGARFRGFIHAPQARILVGGILLSWIYITGVGVAVMWCLADQRRRCPVCLRRLVLPVTIGSWASMFEAVSTELLCDRGHGARTVPESEIAAPEQWVAHDRS
ncbi:MAG TPA: hypothetical protein VGF59_12255 [Bryobacteraceae bacterium]|jgi:hypothetical protein